jgi:Na+/H+ antiporter NhaD/arsenite permease-like protein
MSDETITFLVLAATVAVFIWDRLPVAVVAVAVALSLWATGVLDLQQSLAGFGDPTVIFIASLFVVSEALDATGITTWAGQELIARAGEGRTRVLVLMMLLCAGLTALITVNGSVAALVPVVVLMAVRLRREPSQLLIPLAFAAHAGSLLVLTGSPVNVVVAEAAEDAASAGSGTSTSRSSESRSSRARSRSSSSSASASCRIERRARCRRTSAPTRGRSCTSTGSTNRAPC